MTASEVVSWTALSVALLTLAGLYVYDREQQRAAYGVASCPPVCYCIRCQLRREPKPPQPPPPKPAPGKS